MGSYGGQRSHMWIYVTILHYDHEGQGNCPTLWMSRSSGDLGHHPAVWLPGSRGGQGHHSTLWMSRSMGNQGHPYEK